MVFRNNFLGLDVSQEPKLSQSPQISSLGMMIIMRSFFLEMVWETELDF